MIENIDWHCKWVWITSKTYGKFLMYHLDRFNQAYESGYYTYSLRELLESKEYDCFVDVGSYSGYFAIVGSKYCKKVIAFEADPFLFGLTLYNTQFLKNVECRYKWISVKGDVPKTSGLVARTVGARESKAYTVPVATLDAELKDLQFNKILIKMDIEGNEIKALMGAINLTKNPNVHWHIEVHKLAGVTDMDVISFFENRDCAFEFNDAIIVKGVKK